MRFVDPKIDIAFKKIFGDESRKHVLISLLNAVLEKDIVQIELLNPYQVPKIPELKFTILDIKAKDRQGQEFIVEMQANPYKYFDKRALHYVSKAYVNQLQGGQDYKSHQPVYFVGVLNFNFFNSKHYLSCHLIQNIETQEQEIRDFEFYFLELKKFDQTLDHTATILDKWTYFLKKINQESEIPALLAEEPAILDAAKAANQATWTQEELEAYEKGLREEQKELDMIEELKQQQQLISEKEQVISEKEQVISEKEQVISQKEQVISQKEQVISEKDLLLKRSVQHFLALGQSTAQIAQILNITETEVKKLAGK